MPNFRNEKLRELFMHTAAIFLQENSNGSALLPVTNAVVSPNGKYATIFFTVFPVDKEKTALEFAKRKRPEFKAFVKEKVRMRVLPMFDFEIDGGEKNRQKIDDISREL